MVAVLARAAVTPDELLGIGASAPHPAPVPALPPTGLVAALAESVIPLDALLGLPTTGPAPTAADHTGTRPAAGVVAALARAAVTPDELLGLPSAAPRPSAPRHAHIPPAAASEAARSGAPTRAAAPPGLVAGVQRGLVRRGYAPGPIDGVLGPRTRAAIRAFQHAAGLAADGAPTAALLAHLGAAGDAVDAAATSEPPPPPAAERDGGAGQADGRARRGAVGGIDGVIPGALAITGDDALTAIVERRGLGQP